MVNHVVVAAHFWVLIAQGVEAVCTGHDDLALLRWYAFERIVQNLDVLLCHHLEEELVTSTAGGITGTAFALTQYGELHTSGVQQVRHGAGGLGSVVVVYAGTTNPEQVLGIVEVLDVLAVNRDVDAVCLGRFDPLGTLVVVLAPRVSLGFHVLEQATQLGWEFGVHQHLVTAHIHNVVDVLDVHWALLNTSTTVGAGPQDVWIDYTLLAGSNQLQQRHVGVCVDGWVVQNRSATGEHASTTGALGFGGLQVWGRFDSVIAQRGDQQLRAQWLCGVPCGALFLATSTLRTGGEVHPALPGEVVNGARTDFVGVWVGVLHGQDATVGGHGLCCAQGVATIGVALQEYVEERHEAVPSDTPLDVLANDEQPDHAGQQLDQGEDGNQQRGFRQNLGHLHGEEVRCCMAALVAGESSDLRSLHQDHAQTLDQDHGFHKVCGLGVRAVEAGLLILVTDLLTDDDQRDDAQDGAQTQ